MAIIVRLTGGLMLAYSALYTAHFIFDTLYDAQPVWTVFNVISAAGILIALAVNFAHMRAQYGQQAVTVSRLGANALFYANAALAIWFFRNWATCWREGANRSASTRTSSAGHRSVILWFLTPRDGELWRESGVRTWSPSKVPTEARGLELSQSPKAQFKGGSVYRPK